MLLEIIKWKSKPIKSCRETLFLAQPGTVLEAAAPGTSYLSLHDEWLPTCPCCTAHGERILVQYRVLLNNSDFLHLRSEKYYIGLDDYSQILIVEKERYI